MHPNFDRLVVRAGLGAGVLVLATACSEGSDSTASTAGTGGGGSGGRAGSSGTSAGGMGATGATGGSSSGGTSGSAGSGGSGASPSFEKSWTFASGLEGWDKLYGSPASLKTDAMVTADPADGSPDKGSVKIEIPFSAADQKLDVGINLSTPADLTGKTLSAMIKLDSGLSTGTSNPGGAKLYVKSGAGFVFADGGWNNLSVGGFTKITRNPANPGFVDTANEAGAFNQADIREIGVEIATGSTATATWSAAVVHLDTVGY